MKKKKNNSKRKIYRIIKILPIVSILILIASTTMVSTLLKQDFRRIEREVSKVFHPKESFIEEVNKYAQENYKKYNILPSLTISQAILESNWGKSELSSKYNNYFGIKSIDKNDNRVIFSTKEYINSNQVEVKDAFRVFDSMEDSVRYHGLLVGTAPLYERVVKSKDYIEGANMLYECGYATDPYYAEKLISIIEEYKLYEYDKKI